MTARTLAGHCVPCQDRGQLVQAVDATRTLCQFHVRMGAPSSATRLSRVAPALAGGTDLQHRLRRARLSCSPVRKAPKDPGSKRRLSPRRMEEHAALLVVQAVSACRQPRVLAWLALALYDIDVSRPPGASRSDARSNIARLAAVLAVSADWRSGRRSRPGRQVAAALNGFAEKTFTRHAKLLGDRGLVSVEDPGELLTAKQRAAAAADEDVSPAQRKRWVNRVEFRLLIPDWAREITDEDLWPYVEQAAAWLDELAAPARTLTAVDAPGDTPVDNHPGQRPSSGNVPPSLIPAVIGSVPVRRGLFSCPVAVEKPPSAPSSVPAGKGHKGGATRHSPTDGVRSDRKCRWAPGAARLARELAADGRFGFIRGADDVPALAGVLTKLRLDRWTPDDVAAEAELRLREAGNRAMLDRDEIHAPASYLAWLLARAVPEEPPAQIAAALTAAAQADAAWADVLVRDRAAAAATPSAGRRAARAAAAAAHLRSRQQRR
ncbi:hypothetical protein ACQEVZ_60790 [Dactylosporangium sp. CA-152071]|uniref:hypothetical protein n=1 Tax=Dactylosporangium sp. CA-152071 TaxID=3239933 RepID=UPI003D8AB717